MSTREVITRRGWQVSEARDEYMVMGREALEAVEAGLWEQVVEEAQVVIGNGLPYHDIRPVLADFYEEYGGESGLVMAGCLRWCVANGRVVWKTWFNAAVYGGGDPNDLPERLFHLLKHDGEYSTTTDYFRDYACPKDAYLDLLQALRKLGREVVTR